MMETHTDAAKLPQEEMGYRPAEILDDPRGTRMFAITFDL
jgi:hypothetical protein